MCSRMYRGTKKIAVIRLISGKKMISDLDKFLDVQRFTFWLVPCSDVVVMFGLDSTGLFYALVKLDDMRL